MRFTMYAIRSKRTGKWFCHKSQSKALGDVSAFCDKWYWGDVPTYLTTSSSADYFMKRLRKQKI